MAWGWFEPPRRTAAICGLAIAIGFGAAAAPAADAVTRTQAQRTVERALRPLLRSGDARLFALPAALPRGAVVTEGGIPQRRLRSARRRGNTLRARVPARPLRRPAFMFWLDQAPGGGFQKPGMIVLVDRRSGRIERRQSTSWWPVVNGRRINTPDVRRPRAVPPPAWSAAIVPGLRNDCIVTIGDRTDPYFLKGLAAVTARGQALGMRVAAARRVRDLGPKIDELARGNPPCTDVMIYIAAHGWGPLNTDVTMPNGDPIAKSDKARVTIKSTVGAGANPQVTEENLDFDHVKKLIHDRPSLTFKLAVESCFSGRWTLLMAEPNLRITLTSARSSEVTFLAVTHAQAGTQSKGELKWDDSAPVGTPDGADVPPPFTKGLTDALDQWSESPAERAKGEDLGEALGYAGEHREGDRARTLGWQHGQTDDRTGQRPHAPPPGQGVPPPQQPPGQVAYEVSVNGSYRHIGPGSSEVCWDIRTIPPRPEAQVTVRTSGPGVVNGGSQSVRLDDQGFVRIRVAIDQFGTYSSGADVVATDGAARSGSGNVTVGNQQGTCPPP